MSAFLSISFPFPPFSRFLLQYDISTQISLSFLLALINLLSPTLSILFFYQSLLGTETESESRPFQFTLTQQQTSSDWRFWYKVHTYRKSSSVQGLLLLLKKKRFVDLCLIFYISWLGPTDDCTYLLYVLVTVQYQRNNLSTINWLTRKRSPKGNNSYYLIRRCRNRNVETPVLEIWIGTMGSLSSIRNLVVASTLGAIWLQSTNCKFPSSFFYSLLSTN